MIWEEEPDLTPLRIAEQYNYQPVNVYEDKFLVISTTPSRFGPYVTVKHAGSDRGVVVLLFSQGKVLLVQQARYPIGQEIWELPRGMAETKETLSEAAIRELQEETSLSIHDKASLVSLGLMLTDSGIVSTKVELFYAELDNNYFTEGDLLETENASWFSMESVEQAIKEGKIQDNFTVAALYKAKLAGLLTATVEN